jgi:cell division protein FtsI (penicillin-binding protein 3)
VRSTARPRPAHQPPRRVSGPARRPVPPRPPRTLRLSDPTRRLRAGALVLALVLSLFLGRLLQLQAVDAPSYAARAEAGRLKTVELTAARGDITDRNGVVLATSAAAVDVTADQTLVTDPASEAMALAPLLGRPAGQIVESLTGTKRFSYVARQVSPQVWEQVKALQLPGIFSQDTTVRVYPDGGLGAAVVGFVGRDGSGLGGLELSENTLLAGTNGYDTYEAGADGREIPSSESSQRDPVDGSSVRLTIDRDIQWAAEKALSAQVRAADADSGTVVVMDPRSGAILALATAPSFNPSQPGAAPVQDRGNRALSEVYEPGSTSKVMTVAAVIQERTMTPNSAVTVPNSIWRGGRQFHDDVSHGTWHLTLTGVLAKSSNIGAIQAADTIGENKLDQYLTLFGMGQPTGMRFPGESRGILAPVSKWTRAQFATLAFGQGMSLNAVQATSVYATIANDGVRVEPTLVAGTTSPTGTFTSTPAPQKVRVVSAQTAATVRAMLESVVSDDGTAPKASIAGYRVAGKTGTANRVDPDCGCYRGYTASFIGFAPADHPRLVVSVVLQNPRHGHFGGQLAAPVFKTVMSFALQSLDIPPTGSTAPRMRIWAR